MENKYLEELEKVICEIKRDEKARLTREYYKNHPDKKKISNKKWNDKNRKEYQRAYRLKKQNE